MQSYLSRHTYTISKILGREWWKVMLVSNKGQLASVYTMEDWSHDPRAKLVSQIRWGVSHCCKFSDYINLKVYFLKNKIIK